MALTLTVTDAGRAALVNAQHTGTAPVTIAEVGLTATAVTPLATTAVLPGEYKRLATLSGDVVAADTMHLIVRDETADVFTLRSFGLYLADGTLFAVYGQPGVLLEKSAQAVMLLAIDVIFADIDAALLTFGDTSFLNPPATTTAQGVVELATEAEATAGVDTVRAVTPKAMRTAINGLLTTLLADVWRASNDGSGSGLDADLIDGLHLADLMAWRGDVHESALDGAMGNGFYRVQFATHTGGLLVFTPPFSSVGTVQILCQYTGALAWRNRTNAAVWSAWRTIWHSASDGAGSGLDADLLDGYQSADFVRTVGGTITGGLIFGGADGHVAIRPGFPGRSGHIEFIGDAGVRQGYIGFALDGADIILAANSAPGFTTNKNFSIGGELRRGGHLVWDAGLDGAGSGLDADLLDGQQGSYYTNITARLGFTPLNVTAYTAADVLAKLLSVDGAGSGIDADLLDGQQGSYYADIPARLGFAPLAAAAYTATDVLAKLLSVDGAGSGLDADLLDGQQGSYYTNITARLGFTPLNVTAYTAADVLAKLLSVDGAGSGIDADLIDGLHASDLLPTGMLGSDGWCRLPNGLIFQWGRYFAAANAYSNITFPIAFPSACHHISCAAATEVGNTAAADNGPMPYSASATGAGLWNASNAVNAWWWAIGV